MTITNGYTDLTTMKGADVLNISATDTTSDSMIEIIIEAASRAIDADCGRYFYKSATDEARYYQAEWVDKLWPDDIVSVTELATDTANDRTYTNIWASSDYDLFPYNAPVIGWPYTSIEMTANSSFVFPKYRKGVRVTGIFGWPAVPQKVKLACVLLSASMFKRLSTPLGVASMAAMGEIMVSIKDKDPDYFHLLHEFTRKV